MTNLTFSLVVCLGSCVAGFLGALTGLGGGVVIIPLLVIGLNVDLRYAIGASLISVIATSSGAASAYVKEGYSNVRMTPSIARTFIAPEPIPSSPERMPAIAISPKPRGTLRARYRTGPVGVG